MKFHNYRTYYDIMKGYHPDIPSFGTREKKNSGIREKKNSMSFKVMSFYYAALNAAMSTRSEVAITAENQMKMEINWIKASKPYYNVWPKIIPMLTKLDLGRKKASDVKPPMKELCIRFPAEGNPLSFDFEGEKNFIRCIMLSEAEVQGIRGLSIWVDIDEIEIDVPVYSFYNFRCKEGLTIEEEIKNMPRKPSAYIGVIVPQNIIEDCIRVCCTLCFLADDPQIIVPDVLSKDTRKFEDNPEQKFVDRAKRRGKFGWNVGRSLEVSPHIRGGHDALYWTGKGRLIPKIIRRKGAIIHKNMIKSVPTGHLGDK